ncbi:MAG: carboxymuconolactone decarboxylase family protein [Dehalococcoidia bacterium]|jgi:AhpD family alkylhydroperoxidase
MARISYATTSQAKGDAHDVLEHMRQRGGEILNIHRAVARSPNTLRNFIRLGNSLLAHGQLPPNLRELAILRIAQITGADYEWAHHVPLAMKAGVSEAQIEGLSAWRDNDMFSSLERAVVAYAEGVVTSRDVPDDIFEAVRNQLGEDDVVELTLVCGYWNMVACLLLALKIDLEPAARKYLPK